MRRMTNLATLGFLGGAAVGALVWSIQMRRYRRDLFSVLVRRFLKQGDFPSAEEFAARLGAFLEDYNAHHAHPYRWTYDGTPLVRGIPFSQTRRQQRRGRAWFSPRPRQFERYFYPPRPYRRQLKRTG